MFDVSSVDPAFDVGVGVVAFVTNRDRRVLGRPAVSELGSDSAERSAGFDGEHLSFWRATMAVVIRY